MNSPNSDADMADLADALTHLRNELMHLSLALKDYLAEMPSQARDNAQAEVAAQLEKLRRGCGRTL